MYVQVVTYALGGMDEGEYFDVAHELAPRFSGLPGLQAKIWLEDPDLGRYGAIYFWDDRESMERFLRSDLFEGTNPDFEAVDSEGFGILANLTAQTQPGLEVVPPPRRAAGQRPAQKALPTKPPATKSPAAGGPRKIPVATKSASAEAPAKKAATAKAAVKKSPAVKAPAKKKTPRKPAG